MFWLFSSSHSLRVTLSLLDRLQPVSCADLFLHSLLRLRVPTLRLGGGAMGGNLPSGPGKWLHLVLSGDFAWLLYPHPFLGHRSPAVLSPAVGEKKSPFFCWLLTQETGGQPHFSSLNQSCSASPYAGLPPAWGLHLARGIPPRTVGLWLSHDQHSQHQWFNLLLLHKNQILWAHSPRPPVEPFCWPEVPTRGGGNALHPY